MSLRISFSRPHVVSVAPPPSPVSAVAEVAASDTLHLVEAASALSAAALDCSAALAHLSRGGRLHERSEPVDGQTLRSIADAAIEIIDLRGCPNTDRPLRAALVAWIDQDEARHG